MTNGDATKQQFIQAHAAGMTYRAIGKLCNVSIRTTMVWRGELGLPHRPRGRRKKAAITDNEGIK